jgi:Zn-dependent protease
MNNRKIYYSFQDMPGSNSYSSNYSSTPQGLKFSKTEIIHLLIAMGVLTIAFTFAFVGGIPGADSQSILFYLPLAFTAIVTAFICHEIAHKYMGQKYGYWSEFRMYPMGLILALFLGVATGFVFAAPGAVRIFGNPNKEQSGKISVAGPLTNIIIAVIATGFTLFTTDYIFYVAFMIAWINAFLAFFNLLPFGPLDGGKIFRWNKGIWVAMIIVSLSLFISPNI